MPELTRVILYSCGGECVHPAFRVITVAGCSGYNKVKKSSQMPIMKLGLFFTEARVVWSLDERNTFCSHDLGLSDDGQNITVYQRGVYEVSFKTCVLCDDENGKFVPVRSEMTLYRNSEPVPGCSVVKYGPGSLQGTCSVMILLEDDMLSVRINSNLWSRDLTSLDLFLRTRKLY